MKNLKCFLLKQNSESIKFLVMLTVMIFIYSNVPAQKPNEKKLPKDEYQINSDSILKIAHEAIKKIDFEKINLEIRSAMKALDTLNINARIKEALANVDFAKITLSLDSAIKKMQSVEIKHQLELSRKQLIELQKNKSLIPKVEMEKIKKELKETQIQMEKLREELKKNLKAGDTDNTAFQVNFRDYNNSLPFIIF